MNKFKQVDIIKSEEKNDRFLALSICSIVAMYILTLCVVEFVYRRDKLVCPHVSIFFPLGVWLASKKKKKLFENVNTLCF